MTADSVTSTVNWSASTSWRVRVQAASAHVDGDSEPPSLVSPFADLAERVIDDPIGQRIDESAPLGERNELRRRDETSVALPAHQGFELVQIVAGRAHDRLVVKL
jgi:hypothetical protein